MPTQAHPLQQTKGRFAVPFSVCSGVALLLALMTDLMGVFQGASATLKAAWESHGVAFSSTIGITHASGLILSAAAIAGLVAATLKTSGTARRVILGIFTLALVATLAPTFALWGIFWTPFSLALGVGWGWLSALIYARIQDQATEETLSQKITATPEIQELKKSPAPVIPSAPVTRKRPVKNRSRRSHG